MKLGAIYVNGWASAENPQAAGVAIGRGERLHADGKRSRTMVTKVATPGGVLRLSPLVLAVDCWRFEDLAAACHRAVEMRHAAAAAYASEVLRPLEFDDDVKGKVHRGEYRPPTFKEWEAACAKGAEP